MIDLVAELDALLVIWRGRRTTPTAELIDELSSWFALALPPIPGRYDEQRKAWQVRAKQRVAFELPRLLPMVGNWWRLDQELVVLADWPIDPRMTWLAQRLAQQRFSLLMDQEIGFRLFDLLEHHADPRALAALDLPAAVDTLIGAQNARLRARGKVVIAWIEKHDVEITADERVAHDLRAARIAAELDTGRALRDAVQSGADDGSRAVYLDWLMERGYVPPR